MHFFPPYLDMHRGLNTPWQIHFKWIKLSSVSIYLQLSIKGSHKCVLPLTFSVFGGSLGLIRTFRSTLQWLWCKRYMRCSQPQSEIIQCYIFTIYSMLQSGSNADGSMNEEKGFDQECSRCFGGTLELTITGAPQVAAAHCGLPDFSCSSSYPGMVTRLELLCHTRLNGLRTHTYWRLAVGGPIKGH